MKVAETTETCRRLIIYVQVFYLCEIVGSLNGLNIRLMHGCGAQQVAVIACSALSTLYLHIAK